VLAFWKRSVKIYMLRGANLPVSKRVRLSKEVAHELVVIRDKLTCSPMQKAPTQFMSQKFDENVKSHISMRTYFSRNCAKGTCKTFYLASSPLAGS
jgi:hypothetical protein